MSGWISLALWVGTGIVPAGAAAEQQAQQPARVSCDAIVAQVLQTHPGAIAARAGVMSQDNTNLALRWLSDTELRIRSDADTRGGDNRVGLRVGVPQPWEPGARRDRYAARQDLSVAEAQLVLAEIAAKVRTAIAQHRYTAGRVNFLRRTMQKASERMEMIRIMLRAGSITELDRRKYALQLQRTKLDMQDEARKLGQTRLQLQGWRIDSGASIGKCETVGDAGESAVTRHPAMQIARASLREADARHQLERRMWLWPSFLEFTVVEQRRGDDGILLQAGVELPGDSDGRRRAAAAAAARLAQVDQVRAQLTANLKDARQRHSSSLAAISDLLASSGMIDDTKKILTDSDKAGLDLRQIWAVEDQVMSWERRVLDAEHEREVAAIELRRAIAAE